jgi:hypothetical protein
MRGAATVQQRFWNAKYLVSRTSKRSAGIRGEATKYQHAGICSSPLRGAGKIAPERRGYAQVGQTPKDESHWMTLRHMPPAFETFYVRKTLFIHVN